MRLLLSFLLILLSTSVFGQKQKVVTFVFTDPTSLKLPTANYTEVTDKTFTVGKAISHSLVVVVRNWVFGIPSGMAVTIWKWTVAADCL